MSKTSISIVLGQQPSIILPGQKVSGRVKFSIHAQKSVDAIIIVFEGQCFTHMTTASGGGNGGRVHHRETISLFSFTQSLFQGPYTMSPTTLSLPFSFTLPEGSNFTRTKRNSNSERFKRGPQPLPPSIDINYIYDSRISYHLTATLNPSSFFGSQKTELPIQVTTVSSQPCPVLFTRPFLNALQSYQSNSLRLQQHTFKQKMAHIFTSDPNLRTPSITFIPKIHMPSCASVWQYLPLAISIQHLSSGPTDPQNPTLIVQIVTLELKQYTSILADSHSTQDKCVISHRGITVNRKLPLDGTPLDISNAQGSNTNAVAPIRLADVEKGARLPVPSFRTYTINHSYKIKLEILVQHPETMHQFRFSSKTAFEILPPFMGNERLMVENTRELAMERVGSAIDTVLPAYQDAVGMVGSKEESSSMQHKNYVPGSKVGKSSGDEGRFGKRFGGMTVSGIGA